MRPTGNIANKGKQQTAWQGIVFVGTAGRDRHGHVLTYILLVQAALFLLCSCRAVSSNAGTTARQDSVSVIADKVWTYAQSHPAGFTLDLRTMTEPTEGIAVSYAATQNSHSRPRLDKVVSHALQNEGYVGGWYNSEDGLYYFDSSRLFPEDQLDEALRFGRENKQHSVFILSTQSERSLADAPSLQAAMPTEAEHSPSVLIIMYDQEIDKAPLLKAIEDYQAEIIYDYSIIPSLAIKKPAHKTLEETKQHFQQVRGVISVEYDHIYHLDAP